MPLPLESRVVAYAVLSPVPVIARVVRRIVDDRRRRLLDDRLLLLRRLHRALVLLHRPLGILQLLRQGLLSLAVPLIHLLLLLLELVFQGLPLVRVGDFAQHRFELPLILSPLLIILLALGFVL